MPRVQPKSWDRASGVFQLDKIDQNRINKQVNPLWNAKPIIPFEYIPPEFSEFYAERLTANEESSGSAVPASSEVSEQTVAGAKTLKYKNVPKKVRIMLDVKDPKTQFYQFDEVSHYKKLKESMKNSPIRKYH